MSQLTTRSSDEQILQSVTSSRLCGLAAIYVPLRGLNQGDHQVALVRRINRKYKVISRKREDPLLS